MGDSSNFFFKERQKSPVGRQKVICGEAAVEHSSHQGRDRGHQWRRVLCNERKVVIRLVMEEI
jgi:hypothetical protein